MMKKSLGLILVLALAFQASTAVPLDLNSITGPLTDYYNTVVSSLSGATSNLLTGINNILNSLSTTATDVANNLKAIPEGGIQLAFDLLNVTSAATADTLTALNTRLSQIAAQTDLSSLQQLIQKIQASVGSIPSQLGAQLGNEIVSMIDQLNNLSLTNAAQATVDSITQSFGDLLNTINSGVAQLPTGTIDVTQLQADVSAAVTNLVTPLVELSQSADQAVATAANNLLAQTQTLVDNFQTTLKTIADSAVAATTNVAANVQTAIQNIINAAAQTTADALKAATAASSAIIDQKVQLAKQIFNSTQTVVKSVTNSLSAVGLQARALLPTLQQKAIDALAYANNTRAQLQNMTATYLASAQAGAVALRDQMNQLFADATVQIQAALNSTSAATQACAVAAYQAAQTTLDNTQTALITCSDVAQVKIQTAQNTTLDQVTNVLAGSEQLSSNAATCIKDYQAGKTGSLAAANCLLTVSAQAALNTLTNSFSSLIANLQQGASAALAAETTCANTRIANAQDLIQNALNTFNTCTGAAA